MEASRQLACSPSRHSLYSNYHQQHSRDNPTQSFSLTTALLILNAHTKMTRIDTQDVLRTIVTRHWHKQSCRQRAQDGIKYSQQTYLQTKALRIPLMNAAKWRKWDTEEKKRCGVVTMINNDLYSYMKVKREDGGKENIQGTISFVKQKVKMPPPLLIPDILLKNLAHWQNITWPLSLQVRNTKMSRR